MKRILAVTLVAALVLIGLPAPPAEAARPQGNGQIGGTARDSDQTPLSGYKVQLRNFANGQLVGITKTNAAGEFLFTGLNPGTYVIEIVDASGKIMATSAQLSLAGGTMTISGLAVVVTAAGRAAAIAAAGGGSFFTSTGGIVLLAAAGVGITAGIVRATGSPSK